MADLHLTRVPGDRNLYVLEGVGTLRLRGFWNKNATVETGERSYELVKRGVFASTFEATDAAGSPVATFRGRTLKRGGTLTWQGKDYGLRPASAFRERYALVEGDTELATIEGRGWGKRPVKVAIGAPTLDPGLLLFGAFVVRGLAADAASSAGGGASAAATG